MRKAEQTLEEWMEDAEKSGYTVLLRRQGRLASLSPPDCDLFDDEQFDFAREFLREHPSVQVVAFKPSKD